MFDRFKQATMQIVEKLDKLKQDYLDKKLIEAVEQNQPADVAYYLKKGANVDTVIKDSWRFPYSATALIGASFWGYTEIVNLLLQAKANVNASSTFKKNAIVSTALYWAVVFGHRDIVESLLKAGASQSCIASFWKFEISTNDRYYDEGGNEYTITREIAESLIKYPDKASCKVSCVAEIRRIARILFQGHTEQNSPLSKLPSEVLIQIASEMNDKAFDNRTRYKIAYYFFKSPPITKQHIKDEEKYMIGLNRITS